MFVEKLRALCKQPSVSAQNLGLDETAELVGKLLQEFGFTVEEFSPSKGPPVVFAELRSKTGRRTLVFYNHYDVQPVEPVELWKNPPFSAIVEDGRVYARGASDNKGNIISRLMAINALLKVAGDVPCNIKWVIEGEEEIGSPHFSEFITRYKERDRKSTRLNSSHVRISYAVFCLKKKKRMMNLSHIDIVYSELKLRTT